MTANRNPESLQPPAAILACILPGLGYLWFGDALRAAYVFAGVMGLFIGGLFIGGIDVIDRREDRWWFLLQAGVGPAAFVADHFNQAGKSALDPVTGDPLVSKSVGRVNEAGSLMAALAGMLNAIAVIDCLWHAPTTPRRRRTRSTDMPPSSASSPRAS